MFIGATYMWESLVMSNSKGVIRIWGLYTILVGKGIKALMGNKRLFGKINAFAGAQTGNKKVCENVYTGQNGLSSP